MTEFLRGAVPAIKPYRNYKRLLDAIYRSSDDGTAQALTVE